MTFVLFTFGFQNLHGSLMGNALVGAVVVLVFLLQLLSVHALAPVHDHARHVLAPSVSAPYKPTGASHTGASLVNPSEPHTSGLIMTHETSQLSAQARSYWVKQLTFNYGGIEVKDTFHTSNAVAEHINANRGETKTNFVVATLGVIHKASYADLGYPPSKTCFNSGGNGEAVGEYKCLGGFNAAGSEAKFDDFLKRQTGGTKPTPMHYYHSEQALLAYLFFDSEECTTKGLAECNFGKALANSGVNPCDVEVLVLDLISVPNSVCGKCDLGLEQARFSDNYATAMSTFCKSSIAPKLAVRTSSYKLYSGGFRHIKEGLEDKDPTEVSKVIAANSKTVIHSEPKS